MRFTLTGNFTSVHELRHIMDCVKEDVTKINAEPGSEWHVHTVEDKTIVLFFEEDEVEDVTPRRPALRLINGEKTEK